MLFYTKMKPRALCADTDAGLVVAQDYVPIVAKANTYMRTVLKVGPMTQYTTVQFVSMGAIRMNWALNHAKNAFQGAFCLTILPMRRLMIVCRNASCALQVGTTKKTHQKDAKRV